MKKIIYILFISLPGLASVAQRENILILRGNRYYKEKQMDLAKQQYQKAVEQAPENPAAVYNLGNAQFRKTNYADAVKSYEASIQHTQDKTIQEKGWYNSGVAWVKQQKLMESIDSWKKALKLDPSDEDARENLQKALLELEKNKPKQQKNDQKQDKKNQQQQNQQQPKPQQSRLTKQQVEQLLNALQQKEKEVQSKMNQNKVKSLSQPDKDW